MRVLAGCLALVALSGACSPGAPDSARERRVAVTVSVADGRDPAGLQVTAQRREPGEPYRVFVVDILDSPVSVSAPSCSEALRRARDQAEAMSAQPGRECREEVRQETTVTDEWTGVVDEDGVVRLDLQAGRYEVFGLAPTSGGCDLAGTMVIEEGDDAGELRLDSDTCQGG